MSENPLRCPKCHLCNLIKVVWGEWKCPSCGYILGSSVTQEIVEKSALSDKVKEIEELKYAAAIGDSESMRSLVAFLDNGDSNFQSIIESFLLHHKQDSIDVVIDALKSPSTLKKNTLINLLGKFRDEKAVKPLISLLNTQTLENKVLAIKALGILGDKKAVPPLIQQLTNPNSAIKNTAIEALLLIDDERAIVPIINALETSTDQICENFFKYFGNKSKLFDQIVCDKDTSLKIWKISVRLLNCENHSTVSDAKVVFQRLLPDFSTQISETIDIAPNRAKYEIIKLLGNIDDENSVNWILTQIPASKMNILNLSVQSLLKNNKTLPVMEKYFEEKNFEPFNVLITAYSRNEDKAISKNFELLFQKIKDISVQQLKSKIDESTDIQRYKIIHLLLQMHVDLPLEKLLRQISIFPEDESRVEIIQVLGKKDNFLASKLLISLFQLSKNFNVQQACVNSLVKINDPSAIPVLIKLLESKDKSVRRNAEDIIIGLNVPQISDDLIEQRKKIAKERKQKRNEIKRRKNASKIRDPRITKILVASKSRDKKYRIEAISALKNINSDEAMQALIEISHYTDPVASNLATKILRQKWKK